MHGNRRPHIFIKVVGRIGAILLSGALLPSMGNAGTSRFLTNPLTNSVEAQPTGSSAGDIHPGHLVYSTELNLGTKATSDDSLGSRVALSADGRTAIVGAPYRTVDGKKSAGAVVVYRFDGSGWSEPTELNLGSAAHGPYGTSVGDLFGLAVALSADGNTALVGAPYREVNSSGRGQGAAEVFKFRDGGWSQATQLSLGSQARGEIAGVNGDLFGLSLALSSDGNTALIGAPYRSVGGKAGAGAAFVYRFNGGTWGKPTELSLGARAGTGDGFGLSEDLSGDGNVAVIGAPWRYPSNGASEGAAEVFRFTAATWGDPTELRLEPNVGHYFGYSVALTADGETMLVTGGQEPETGSDAEILRFANGQWSASAALNLPSIGPAALSGDGKAILIGDCCGSSLPGLFSRGAAQELRLSDGVWSPPIEVSLPTPPATNEQFGVSVALSDDGSVALVGAPGQSVDGNKCRTGRFGTVCPGAAEVFVYDPMALSVIVTVNASGPYGSTPNLAGLLPDDPRIRYSPPAEAANITGMLTCGTSATNTSPAGRYPILQCVGLSDPGHAMAYDYAGSSYDVLLAPVTLAYTGPRSIERGANVKLSAKLTDRRGVPISGRVLRMQIGRGHYTQSCVTHKTNTAGRAGCVIKKVAAWKSPNPARVWFDGDSPGPNYDYAPGYKRTPVTIVN